MKKIFLIAGKSGGHIIPLISYAKKYLNSKNSEFFFITSNSELEKKIIEEEKLFTKIFFLKLPKIPIWPKDFVYLFHDFFYSIFILIKYKPSEIYTTGGFLSIIFSFLCIFFRKKIFVFHLDAFPGLAGKIIGLFANKNFIIFSCAENNLKKFLFGIKNIEKIDYPLKTFEKIDNYNFKKENLFTIFIMGGSQGSYEINEILKIISLNLIKTKPELFLIHQAGPFKTEIKKFYKKNNIKAFVFDFKKNLTSFYLSADYIISRAGAGSLFEINYFKKKAAIIPLKNSANNHQSLNAIEMSKINNKIFTFLEDNKNEIAMKIIKKINN